MGICGIKTSEGRTYLRIRHEAALQRRYNRFKEEVKHEIGFKESSGFGGHTQIIGDLFSIDITKTDKYMHMVIYAPMKLRTRITDIAYDHFGAHVHKKYPKKKVIAI